MEDINLYDLAFAFTRRPRSRTRTSPPACARTTPCWWSPPADRWPCSTCRTSIRPSYGTLYADADGIREHDPLESIHHDSEGEGDYGDGADDLIAQCAEALGEMNTTNADTIRFVRDRPWYPLDETHVYEIPVTRLAAICVDCWLTLADARFSGDVLPARDCVNATRPDRPRRHHTEGMGTNPWTPL